MSMTTLNKNTTDLQALLETVNSLPSAGGGKKTVTVTIANQTYYNVAYWDEDYTKQTFKNATRNIEALHGLISVPATGVRNFTGDYVQLDTTLYMLLEDGVTVEINSDNEPT